MQAHGQPVYQLIVQLLQQMVGWTKVTYIAANGISTSALLASHSSLSKASLPAGGSKSPVLAVLDVQVSYGKGAHGLT